MEDINKRLDAQGVILNKILDQVYKIDRVEQMVEHIAKELVRTDKHHKTENQE